MKRTNLDLCKFFFFFILYGKESASAATSAEKLCILEKRMDVLEPEGYPQVIPSQSNSFEDRIKALESRMDFLEKLCTARAGMERHCLPPDALNGKAICPEKLPPGATCSLKCNTGYIATPGKEIATCRKDGFWDLDLECEIPLVVIAGGMVDKNNITAEDSSVEIISLYPSQGCNQTIPDMPEADGAHRTLHNLFYTPKKSLLTCNGLTNEYDGAYYGLHKFHRPSCDEWSLKTNAWKRHSYPNEGDGPRDVLCDSKYSSSCLNPDRYRGRYAAEVVINDENLFIVGGMLYDKEEHKPTKSTRVLYKTSDHWFPARDLKQDRAFFCLVKLPEDGVLAIGGLGQSNGGNTVQKSMEFSTLKRRKHTYHRKYKKNYASMNRPRSGHSCSSMPIGNFSVLVAGGTEGFGQPAGATAEIFSFNENTWREVGSMQKSRFGHAVVAVGEKMFAIGGDDRKNNYHDTIEQFDIETGSWKMIFQRLQQPRSNFGYTLIPHSLFKGCHLEKPLIE